MVVTSSTADPHNDVRDTSPAKHDKKSGRRSPNKKSQEKAKKIQEKIPEYKIRARTARLAELKEPTFSIAGCNGVGVVEAALTELNWKRVDKTVESVKLQWVECRTSINYNAFKEGCQMVNRIPNCYLLTNKMGLLNSLQRYDRVQTTVSLGKDLAMKTFDFVPLTYRVDKESERNKFFEDFKDGDIWICKPCGLNQGKGIYLVRDLDEFKKTLEDREKQKTKSHRPMERIVQRYIERPLLLEHRKFDIRCYLLIASTAPFIVMFSHGYVRLCLHDYSLKNENLTAHLTNQFIQKKDAAYKDEKDNSVWTMPKFNQYVNETVAPYKDIEEDWVYNTLTNRIKQIMLHCFHSVKHKLKARLGYFDLYGLDFMVDEEMKIWLIEVNVNPCLATNCEPLREVVPGVVRESLFLAVECFEKSKRNLPILPLQSQNNFQLLFHGTCHPKPNGDTTQQSGKDSPTLAQRPRSLSPSYRRSRSLSPIRDGMAQNITNTAMEEHMKITAKIYGHPKTPTPPYVGNVQQGRLMSPSGVGLRGMLQPNQPVDGTVKMPPINTGSDSIHFKMTHIDNSPPSPQAKKPAGLSNQTSGSATTVMLLRQSRKSPTRLNKTLPISSGYHGNNLEPIEVPKFRYDKSPTNEEYSKNNNNSVKLSNKVYHGNARLSVSTSALWPAKHSITSNVIDNAAPSDSSNNNSLTGSMIVTSYNKQPTPRVASARLRTRSPTPIDKLSLALNMAKRNERGS